MPRHAASMRMTRQVVPPVWLPLMRVVTFFSVWNQGFWKLEGTKSEKAPTSARRRWMWICLAISAWRA